MKKLLFMLSFVCTLSVLKIASADELKTLPKPNISQTSAPLLQLIDARKSQRSYNADKKIDNQTLSEILWVAAGVNQYDKRTIATARNQQNIKVFVLGTDGVWFYNAHKNILEKISDENAIPYTAEQQFVYEAPVHLIYTSSDEKWGSFHAGSASQNVYLYATHKGLATVVRGLIDFKALHKALKLNKDEKVIAHQVIGYAQ